MTTRHCSRSLLSGAVSYVLLCSAGLVWAESGRSADRVEYDLRREAGESGCAGLLSKIERARSEYPGSAPLARLEGECKIERFDYLGAAQALETSARLDPEGQNTQLYLAVALYHLERFDEAWQAIQAADGHYRASATPQYQFYLGLLLLQRGEQADAAEALERAADSSPGEVEPVASYFAGLSFMGIRDREKAREAFERVAAMDPSGEWGKQARTVLDSVALEDRNWLSAQAGVEYDSNVILLGDGIPLAGDISGESDGRAVWFLEGGFQFFESENWSAGLIGSYAGSANFELQQFDVEYPSIGGWLDRMVGENTLLRLRYSFGHAWVGGLRDDDSFLFAQQAVLTGFHDWGTAGRTELSLAWEWNDYKYEIPFVPVATAEGVCPGGFSSCAPFGSESPQAARNRDGNGLRIGLLHKYRIRQARGLLLDSLRLRGGFDYGKYWATGSDWDYSGYRFSLGLDVKLPWRLEFDVEGGYEYAPFENPSSYPNPPLPTDATPYTLSSEDRLDQIGRFAAVLSRPITRRVNASVRYYYIHNDSNVAVFDYDRQIVGVHVSLEL